MVIVKTEWWIYKLLYSYFWACGNFHNKILKPKWKNERDIISIFEYLSQGRYCKENIKEKKPIKIVLKLTQREVHLVSQISNNFKNATDIGC